MAQAASTPSLLGAIARAFLLAKTRLEEETDEERAKPLTMAERAALAGWMWTMESKYEVVGKLEGFDPNSTKM